MRIYQIQKIGGSYYLALPPSIISETMLKLGVQVEVIHYDGMNLVLLIKAGGDENGEHTKDNNKSRKNTP